MKNLILFAIGGIFYVLIELLWRGCSHGTMFLLGGLCFLAITLMNRRLPRTMPILLKMTISAAIITALEFITGYILNIQLGLNVWNYSYLPFNLMGQICLMYSVLWFLLGGACIYIGSRLENAMA